MSDNPVLAAISRLDGRFDGLERSLTDRFEGVDKRLESLEQGQTKLRVDLMARIDRMEDRMTLIRDDISVNMGRADRAHQAAESTRAELRSLGDQVNGMYRMIKTLETQVRDLSGGS